MKRPKRWTAGQASLFSHAQAIHPFPDEVVQALIRALAQLLQEAAGEGPADGAGAQGGGDESETHD
ncbi:MAG: hypothetical protein ACE5FA_03525 [Dehalococcoidia bacterium]